MVIRWSNPKHKDGYSIDWNTIRRRKSRGGDEKSTFS